MRAYAVHPGAIYTDLARHLSEQDINGLIERYTSTGLQAKTVESGAATAFIWRIARWPR